MMNLLQNLKLDKWYGIVLYLGTLSIAASLFTNITFLQPRHLFGLGLGAVLIGLSFWIAEKSMSAIKPPNVYTGGAAFLSWKEIRHNPITLILFIIGICLVGIFGYLLLKNLI